MRGGDPGTFSAYIHGKVIVSKELPNRIMAWYRLQSPSRTDSDSHDHSNGAPVLPRHLTLLTPNFTTGIQNRPSL